MCFNLADFYPTKTCDITFFSLQKHESYQYVGKETYWILPKSMHEKKKKGSPTDVCIQAYLPVLDGPERY